MIIFSFSTLKKLDKSLEILSIPFSIRFRYLFSHILYSFLCLYLVKFVFKTYFLFAESAFKVGAFGKAEKVGCVSIFFVALL